MSRSQQALNLVLKDSLFDPDRPDDKVVQVRRSESKPLYRVFLYLDGPDVPFVNRLTYKLHETFSPNTRTVARTPSNPRCKFDMWTWGVFTVVAVIEDKQGRTFTMSHYLEYTAQLSDKNLAYKTT